MSKLPSFQFYPGDWRKDIGVQSLSYHDRGVWHEMLCLMHESERRGVLVLNGQAMSEDALARLLGLDKQILTTTLTTLLTSGVASREDNGAIFCRRIVRDEKLRQIRTEAGKLGGNPVLVNQKPTTGVNQKPTPSSSSSYTKQKQNPGSADRGTGDLPKPLPPPPPEKRKPPAADQPAKRLMGPYKAALRDHWQLTNPPQVEFPWSEVVGKNLRLWMESSPNTTPEQFREYLRNRRNSDDVNHGENPAVWILNVTRYSNGPLDRYNKPKRGSLNGLDRLNGTGIDRPPETPEEIAADQQRQAAARERALINLATGSARLRQEMLRDGLCTQAEIDEGLRLAARRTQ